MAKLRAAAFFGALMLGRIVLVAVLCAGRAVAQTGDSQPNSLEVSQALAQGDAFMAEKVYDKALDAYHHADKLSHHTCAVCLLRIVSIERKAGDFDGALDTAKKAVAAAGDNKILAAQAHLVRGSLFIAMASKPGDKKLREAEEEFRAALALAPGQSIGHRNLGIALIKQGRDAEGIAELNLFIAAPGNSTKSVEEARAIIANPVRAREPYAPDFAFTSLEGTHVSNAALQGKVVLLDFWATWCPPCRESVPVIAGLHKKYADKAFEIVGISADGDEDTLKTFVERNRMTWTEYLDLSGSVGYTFDVDSYPTYIVVDKEGVVRYRQSGFGPAVAGELEDVINKALKKPFSPALVPGTAPAASATATAPAPAMVAGGSPTRVSGATVSVSSSASVLAAKAADATSGGVYHNGTLGFSYPYPSGWTVASPETIRNANASMKQMDTSGPAPQAGNAAANLSELIFYAYGPGTQNSGSFRAVPSVRITSLESFGAMLTMEVMKRNAGAQENLGMKAIRGPERFTVSDQDLYRMDFEDPREGQSWVSMIQTVVYDHVLTIEILASSPAQLELLVSTVKYSIFADADKK
ncbi:MAG TPA: redoxin family protein [Candidatus Acidoferrum sp.]|nr:redoxin family protein [Candidatus Acidoferrum sp.]